MNFFDSIYLVAFFQTLLFVSLLILKKSKKLSDLFLFCFLLLLALECITTYIGTFITFSGNIYLISINILIWTTLGPMLFLFIRYNIYPDKKFNVWHLLHFLPLLFTIVFTHQFLSEYIGNLSVKFILSFEHPWYVQFGMRLWINTTHIYFTLSIIQLIIHQKRSVYYFSNSDTVNFKWLLYLTIGFALYLYIGVANSYIMEFTNYSYPFDIDHLLGIVILFYVLGMGILGYRQHNIFTGDSITYNEYKTITKSIKSSFADNIKKNDDEIDRLTSLMEIEKPYMDPELTLGKLSHLFKTTPHNLSLLINNDISKSFNEFVNSYRVKEFKKMLNEEKFSSYTILAVSYECGFNSKTTFYKAFKNETGMTPTEYKNKLAN